MSYPARISSEMRSERASPRCPHCGGLNMGDAKISLEDLLGGHMPSYVPVAADGYARDVHAFLLFECPDCFRPAVLAVDSSQVKLVAARTEKDIVYANTMGIWQ